MKYKPASQLLNLVTLLQILGSYPAHMTFAAYLTMQSSHTERLYFTLKKEYAHTEVAPLM
jgi:hypothetical protein